MADSTILSDLLSELGVPYTRQYTDKQFAGMPFMSLFGLSRILASYNIDSEGLRIRDKSELSCLPVPFIANTSGGLVIVTSMGKGRITYLTQGLPENISEIEFSEVWTGEVMLAYPSEDSSEPDYNVHRVAEIVGRIRNWGLWIGILALSSYLFLTNGIFRHVSTVLLAMFDVIGLYLTYLLVQKSLKIKSRVADTVCGVLQEGGCDSILETKASKLLGVFSWSEVGFTYFSVSLLCLLIFPEFTKWLAVCNLCCLPFTIWSIWYQKFRAGAWCTLCVSVQSVLWALFFCYLGGGWLDAVFPLRIELFVLGATYITVLFALNKILLKFDKSDL